MERPPVLAAAAGPVGLGGVRAGRIHIQGHDGIDAAVVKRDAFQVLIQKLDRRDVAMAQGFQYVGG